MAIPDISEVLAIERQSFPNPWPASAYRYELAQNDRAQYFVARPSLSYPAEKGPVVGYGGFWLVTGEAHISTIAVHPDYRRTGLGELLLEAMIEHALSLGADLMTLEVRVSNGGAQGLYHKYGFRESGVRKEYYSDNREDALLMTIPDLKGEKFSGLLAELSSKLSARLQRQSRA
ncbi:MAG: ribosomal protein S18-alanine N-acetyltransferase [Chloroflexi bacterium]|nr:ribosomal protein S18-alanine N-acetyltransferase [Chloroflexota bacterium]